MPSVPPCQPPSTLTFTLSLHDALPIWPVAAEGAPGVSCCGLRVISMDGSTTDVPDSDHGDHPQRSEEHTSELQSHSDLVCRLLLEKKKASVSCGRPAELASL